MARGRNPILDRFIGNVSQKVQDCISVQDGSTASRPPDADIGAVFEIYAPARKPYFWCRGRMPKHDEFACHHQQGHRVECRDKRHYSTAVAESIGFLLDDTSRLYRRAFDARARNWGITSLQWRLLKTIHGHENSRQGALADALEVEPITLSRMIGRLVVAGLVERRTDPADRRVWLLNLTDRAHALLRDIQQVAQTQADEATSGFSQEETEQIFDLVRRVRANLSLQAA